MLAEWIASPNFLNSIGYLTPDSVALELGAGVSGIVALTLGAKIKKYIATDQDYVIRLLKHNIAENLPTASSITGKGANGRHKKAASRQTSPNIQTLQLDWELDSAASLPCLLNTEDGVDLVIACDSI